MPDREKVIIGLSKCGRVHRSLEDCAECPYKLKPGHYAGMKCWCRLCDDALELLKEQEPRVMTLDEVMNTDDFVWVEIWTPRNKRWSLIYARVRTCIDEELLNLQEDSGMEWTRLVCDYNMKGLLDCGWRCWTSRPTEAQRENTPWEPPKGEDDA